MGSSHSFRRKKKNFVMKSVSSNFSPVRFDDFQILRAIGKGSFGKVCIVQKKNSHKMYAMKYMNKNQCIENHAFKNVLQEIEILSSLDHPFLVNLWFTFQDEEDIFMVVDLLLGGDLRYHLQQSNSNFDDARISLYLCEIALALDYLRSKRILHRDIKPDNILLDDTGHAHITDFNIATIVKEGEIVTSVSGTKPYMAPEIIQCILGHKKGYSFSADWWSLGVTAYEMFCRRRPYDIHSRTSAKESLDVIQSTCLLFPKKMNPSGVDLVRKLMVVDPEQRLSSISEMQNHPFFKDIDFDAVYKKQVSPPFVPNKNQLNCDPTFELEEMIVEAKPLHKKKKRLSKRHQQRRSSVKEDSEVLHHLDFIQENFIIYNREKELHKHQMEEKEKIWEEELKKVIS